jgi:hypothetical protein
MNISLFETPLVKVSGLVRGAVLALSLKNAIHISSLITAEISILEAYDKKIHSQGKSLRTTNAAFGRRKR